MVSPLKPAGERSEPAGYHSLADEIDNQRILARRPIFSRFIMAIFMAADYDWWIMQRKQ
jgi:hypothetical protein